MVVRPRHAHVAAHAVADAPCQRPRTAPPRQIGGRCQPAGRASTTRAAASATSSRHGRAIELDADRQAVRATCRRERRPPASRSGCGRRCRCRRTTAALLSPWRIAGCGIAGQTIRSASWNQREQPGPDRVGALDQRASARRRRRAARDRSSRGCSYEPEPGRAGRRDQALEPGVAVAPDQARPTAPRPRRDRAGRSTSTVAPVAAERLRGASTATTVSGVGVRMPLSVNATTRRPPTSTAVRVAERHRRDVRVLAVRPAMIGRRSARSSTRRAIGPSCVEDWQRSPRRTGQWPVRGTRPLVGFMPAMPQTWAGWRMLSPVSLPMSNGEPPAATIAAAPPVLPPGVRVEVVRVRRPAVDVVVGLVGPGELRRVRLAEEDRAGGLAAGRRPSRRGPGTRSSPADRCRPSSRGPRCRASP